MNSYSTAVASEWLQTTVAEYRHIEMCLDDSTEAGNYHGISLAKDPPDARKGPCTILFMAEESFFPEDLDDETKRAIGKLLIANKIDYIEFDVAYTTDKLRPESCGGQKVRIYRDGHLEYAEMVFHHKVKKPRKRK